MKTSDLHLGNYRKLPEHEQLLMRLMAVIYEPVKVSEMNAAYRSLINRDSKSSLPKIKLQGLLRSKLLQVRNSRWSCNPSIIMYLMDQAMALGEMESMTSEINRLQLDAANTGQVGYHIENSYGVFYRALFGGDLKTLLKLLYMESPDDLLIEEDTREFLASAARKLRPESYYRLSPIHCYLLLRPLLRESLQTWSNMKTEFRILQDLVAVDDPSPRLLALYAEQCLARGKLDTARSSAARLEQRRHLAAPLQAAAGFLQGAPEAETRIAFEQALMAIRTSIQDQTAAVPGLAGIIYMLSLLGNSQLREKKLLERQMQLVSQPRYSDEFYWPMHLLEQAAKRTAELELQSYLRQQDSDWNLSLLIVALMTYWNGYDPDENLLLALHKARQQARSAGLDWFERETGCLLAAFEARQIESRADYGPPLLELQPRLEKWEHQLHALQQLQPQEQNKRKKSAAESRIVWFVSSSYYDYELSAKEQKLGKNGKWSRGRSIALKRLAQHDSALNLTEADRKICQQISTRSGYSHYSRVVNYFLHGSHTLLGAIGHPLIFDEDTEERIELVAGKIELQVEEKADYIQLRLEPYPVQLDVCDIFVDKNPGQWTVYEYTDELLEMAGILGNDGLLVPHHGKDKVLESISSVAPLLTIHSSLFEMGDTSAEEVVPDSRLQIQIRPVEDGLRLGFYAQPIANGPLLSPGRGGERIFTEVDGKPLSALRQLDTEKARLDAVLEACPDLCQIARNDYSWETMEEALEGLLTLKSFDDDVVLHWPEGKALNVSMAVDSNQMTVSLRQHTNWFEVDGQLQVDERQVHSMAALLELLPNSRGRFVAMKDGQFLALTDRLRKQLETLASITHKGRVNALGIQTLEASVDGMEVDADKGWQKQLRRLRQARELDPELPSTVEAELRDYQVAGYKWLRRLAEWGAGACLADDMGLGKTLQALTLLVQRGPLGPALVLAPTSVCSNWQEEARRFTPSLNAIRFGTGKRAKTLSELGNHDILVCSYGLLQSESNALQKINWSTVIADEAQAFKNSATKRSRAVMGLSGDFKMIATGTPIENHLGELWNLFSFINPGLLGSREAFNKKFAHPIENQNDRQAAATLRQLVQPFILRRLKNEVLTELPPLTEIMVNVDLSDEETALYEALRREASQEIASADLPPGEHRIQVLAKITRLRRAVCNPNLVLRDAKLPSAKLAAFAAILNDLMENRHRALVFSQFVDHLSLVRAYLDEQGISYRYLDGSTPANKRRAEVEAFQAGEAVLFLISLKAGGVGLNLTAADYVIHMDPWWNPAVEDQASDRAHRIGQQRPVTVYRLVATNTIEEKIVSLHAHKRDLADKLLEGSDSAARMSLDDMLALLEQ